MILSQALLATLLSTALACPAGDTIDMILKARPLKPLPGYVHERVDIHLRYPARLDSGGRRRPRATPVEDNGLLLEIPLREIIPLQDGDDGDTLVRLLIVDSYPIYEWASLSFTSLYVMRTPDLSSVPFVATPAPEYSLTAITMPPPIRQIGQTAYDFFVDSTDHTMTSYIDCFPIMKDRFPLCMQKSSYNNIEYNISYPRYLLPKNKAIKSGIDELLRCFFIENIVDKGK